MSDRIQLYFYNGMSQPERIEADEVGLEQRYKGNITNDFITAYNEVIEGYTLDEMIEYQPLYEYNIFINPSKEILQKYNRSILLDDNQYLDNFD